MRSIGGFKLWQPVVVPSGSKGFGGPLGPSVCVRALSGYRSSTRLVSIVKVSSANLIFECECGCGVAWGERPTPLKTTTELPVICRPSDSIKLTSNNLIYCLCNFARNSNILEFKRWWAQ